ncbi:uncharacterized protein [Misgurnus anguillicaudatus]|uniref:uncharacterized protein isoform X2 n=1 Tax=Misgurnus anguillicaudatus TaxID=75329 RepID=UPI003CCF5B20
MQESSASPQNKMERRAHWVRAIRRDEGPYFKILRGSTFVCSKHFNQEDLYTSPGGLIRIREGAVPSRFRWTDWQYHESQEYQHYYKQGRGLQAQESVCMRERKRFRIDVLDDSKDMVVPKKEEKVAAAAMILWSVAKDHDYVQHASPVKLEHAAQRIQEMDLQVPLIKTETMQLTISSR